uniref:Uncharacterized protein n=1 Tax=Anguilla anguilla TaxID=7936 RepID=A0A0E9UKC1_ANGAN
MVSTQPFQPKRDLPLFYFCVYCLAIFELGQFLI